MRTDPTPSPSPPWVAAIPQLPLLQLTGHLKDPVTLHGWFASVFSRHHSMPQHPGFLSGSPLDSAGLPIGEPASQPSLLFTDLIISGRGEFVGLRLARPDVSKTLA